MVSDLVEIDTLSYIPDAQPVKWICDGGSSYQIGVGERTARGTSITLHINDENKDLLDDYRLKEIIKKYCSFISYEIHFVNETKEGMEELQENKEDKENQTIYYTDNKVQQSSNIELYKQNGLIVVEFSHPIDSRF